MMKKKTLLYLTGAALLASCQSGKQPGHIEIALDEMATDTMLVMSYPVTDVAHDSLKIDTIVPGNTPYTFTPATDSVYYRIQLASTKDLTHTVLLVSIPGETVKVTGNTKDYQVSGSDFNTTLQQVQKACQPYTEKMDSLARHMTKETYKTLYQPTWKQKDSIQADYIRQHPDSDLSLFLLNEIRGYWIDELLPTLTDKVKHGPFAPIAEGMEESLRIQKTFEANKKRVVEGSMAPDFTLKDLQGNDLTLSSLRGKYVMLDFWGSWCGACIHAMPQMKTYYAKYKDRMEIVGIACHDKEEAWKAAVEKYELPWLHVIDTKKNDTALSYAVDLFPSTIIIDPEGRIVKIVPGDSPKLYEYLDELFK